MQGEKTVFGLLLLFIPVCVVKQTQHKQDIDNFIDGSTDGSIDNSIDGLILFDRYIDKFVDGIEVAY